MTTGTRTPSAVRAAARAPSQGSGGIRGFVSATWIIARRGLLHMRRQPEQLTDATIQPVMFVLMFAYVFGGAISVPGDGGVGDVGGSLRYREFLMGGIMAQTLVFAAFGVAMSLANDRKNQAVDRFRSLPIAEGAVLAGHALANLVKALLPILIMSATGLLIGWRIRGGVTDAIAAYLLMIAFSFAMIWVGVLLGSLVRTPEGVSGFAFVALFPLTFVASTFVPLDGMPTALRTVAAWNPATTLSNALRVLFGNPNTPVGAGDPWPIRHPITYTWGFIALIVLVCAPLAIRAYRRSLPR